MLSFDEHEYCRQVLFVVYTVGFILFSYFSISFIFLFIVVIKICTHRDVCEKYLSMRYPYLLSLDSFLLEYMQNEEWWEKKTTTNEMYTLISIDTLIGPVLHCMLYLSHMICFIVFDAIMFFHRSFSFIVCMSLCLNAYHRWILP